jgi:hypothetical protein
MYVVAYHLGLNDPAPTSAMIAFSRASTPPTSTRPSLGHQIRR